MPTWDPQTYARYADERSRPFFDLVAQIRADSPATVVDLGCGTGELTASLAQRWPQAQVRGIDSSPDMLAKAPNVDRLTFEHGDVRHWKPDAPVDVLVTNAVLQWVPDHLPLLQRWVQHLAPGGWIAMQVPGNYTAPSHTLMREVASEPPYAGTLASVLRGTDSVADPSTYAALLADAGCTVDAWETTYLHVLQGNDPVLQWVRGTRLRPVLDALADDLELQSAYVDTYAARLRDAYPRKPWGTLMPFRRIFAVARRAA
jgi:trans-aconitate 2-methyltransferase